MSEVKQKIRRLVTDTFLVFLGVIDLMGIMELVSFAEREFANEYTNTPHGRRQQKRTGEEVGRTD